MNPATSKTMPSRPRGAATNVGIRASDMPSAKSAGLGIVMCASRLKTRMVSVSVRRTQTTARTSDATPDHTSQDRGRGLGETEGPALSDWWDSSIMDPLEWKTVKHTGGASGTRVGRFS